MSTCPHETPGGIDRCAVCRSELAMLNDREAAARAQRARWREAQGVPMPDYVRDVLAQIQTQQGRR